MVDGAGAWDLARMSERTAKSVNGRGKHLWHALRRHGKTRTLATPSPFDKGVSALFPWPVVGYPGPRQGMQAVLDRRAAVPAVDNWRAGRRRAPRWAWALLAIELERRRAELDHALELAKKEAGD